MNESRWFELRDAVLKGEAPALYQGAVACVFNDEKSAINLLNKAMQEAPASEAATDARNLLCMIYHRQEKHQEALAPIQATAKLHPENAGNAAALAFMSAMSSLPDTKVVRLRESRLRYEVKQEKLFNWFAPARIQGKEQHLLLDTGASANLISENEAVRLGLRFVEPQISDRNAAGMPVTMKLALASTMTIGDCELSNVVFQVVPDEAPPFSLLNEGERAVLGLPILLKLRTLRWDREGNFTVAFPSAKFVLAEANLCFESNMPVVLGRVDSRSVMLELDTGGGSNFLFQRFAIDFPDLLKQANAKRGTMTIGGVGGSVEGLESVTLPSVEVDIGGRVLSYKPATVQLGGAESASGKFHGLLGLPLLSQAKSVAIDFGAMRVTFE